MRCLECGIDNPPENRWCACGYDLDKIQEDTPPPIKKDVGQMSSASSHDCQIMLDEAQEESARPKPESIRKSYVRRHWRGELPLAQSYWVNTLAIGLLVQLPFLVLPQTHVIDVWITTAPTLIALGFIAFFVSCYLLAGWQWVGLWRSAENHIRSTRRVLWARLAQVAVILGVISGAVQFVQTGWPEMKEFGRIAFGLSDYGGFTVRVIRQGTEMEVLGGMAFGLSEEVRRQLDANPDVRVIHLNSIGGRIAEARQLRELIQSRNLITYSSRGCQSACASAFMGGSVRVLNRKARLGFHQPSFPGLTPDQTAENIEEERKYFLSRGVDKAFVQKAFSTPNNDMWMPTPDELLKARVITDISEGEQFAMTEAGMKGNVASIEAELSTMPIFQTIKRHDPEAFEQIKAAMEKALTGAASKGEIMALIREESNKLYTRYLPISGDDALLVATRNIVDVLSFLERANPEACYGFLFPVESHVEFWSLLPQNKQHALLDGMAGVIESGVSNPQPVPQEDQVATKMEAVTKALTKRYGNDLALVAKPSAAGVDKAKICSMTAALYQEILKVPDNESAKLLRFLFATG